MSEDLYHPVPCPLLRRSAAKASLSLCSKFDARRSVAVWCPPFRVPYLRSRGSKFEVRCSMFNVRRSRFNDSIIQRFNAPTPPLTHSFTQLLIYSALTLLTLFPF